MNCTPRTILRRPFTIERCFCIAYMANGPWKSSKRSIPTEFRQFESRISFICVDVRRDNFVNSVSFWKCKFAKCYINEFSECPAEELKEVSCTKPADVKNFPRKRGLVMNSFIWRTCNLAYLRGNRTCSPDKGHWVVLKVCLKCSLIE